MLDAQEYLHLAIKASQAKEHFAALDYLHKSIDLSPNNAFAYFLLAAEHAEIGLFERATNEMKKAIGLDPTLYIAKFQLSLLLIEAQEEAEAKDYLFDIVSNSADEPLTHFAQGLMALIQKQPLDEARAEFQLGIHKNTHNPGLNLSIEAILKSMDQDLAGQPAVETPPAGKSETAYGSVLRAYNTESFEEDQ